MAQILIFITLGLALIMFIWDKIRYDFVALSALFLLVVLGIVPAEEAFKGFAHTAVITVAAVMIIGEGMLSSGLIDVVAKYLQKIGDRLFWQIIVLCIITALASAFMNNVGALAIMMPVAIKLSAASNRSPSGILMPLAFSSLLGGMITLIGTPPNIIIASLRHEALGESFRMFDFAPAGLPLAGIGILFMAAIGWRLIPMRKAKPNDADIFKIEDYITEVEISEDSKIIGKSIRELRESDDFEINILSLIRRRLRINVPKDQEVLREGDIIILESDSDNLKAFLDASIVKLVGDPESNEEENDADAKAEKLTIREVVMLDSSRLIGKTAAGIRLRERYGANLLAIARGNRRMIKRIDHSKFKAGDVLLLQGSEDRLSDSIIRMGCLPISDRDIRIGDPQRIISALLIFGAAITALLTGFLPVQIAFSLAALLFVFSGIVSFRNVYENINWPIIVLLAAMIPVGMTLESSGAADMIAASIVEYGSGLAVWQIIGGIMLISMLLSNVVNNAATAVLMAPIALKIAGGLQLSPDAFLMAIALGASSAFLTPIGHQSNTLVMGPGGYKFSDYWRLGLPIQILVLSLGTAIILAVWL
jgi:di/tricarboxylate transporter